LVQVLTLKTDGRNREMEEFNVVKVFSATKAKDRSELGETVTTWLKVALDKGGKIIDKRVIQSSDQEFHCLSIVLFLSLPS
jgi:hypothetical protein